MSNYWDDLMESDEHAATYMETYGEGAGTPLRLKIASYLEPEQKVLDIGCGPGWNFDTFLQHGPAVYYRGKDYSERFVRVANERVKPMKIFEVGDVRDFGEPDSSFDVVIMQDVLEHTNGYRKPMQEALRVSKKRIIVTFWHLTESDDDNPINDDGKDGWGAWYSGPKWERYLDTLPVTWIHVKLPRKDAFHDIYVIDKVGT